MEYEDSTDDVEEYSLPKIFNTFTVPKRIIIGILCTLAIGSTYISLGSIDNAIEHVTYIANVSETEKVAHCPRGPGNESEIIHYARMEFSPLVQNIVVLCYYIGFTISQLPMGMLAERKGFKWPLIAILLTSSIINMLMPVAVELAGALAFIMLNTLLGLAQGGIVPVLNVLVARWYPETERATFGAMLNGSRVLGYIFAALIAIRNLHWSVRYYVSGIGACFAVILIFICRSIPQNDRFISKNERAYLNIAIQHVSPLNELAPTPWKTIFTSFPVWGYFVAQFGHYWFFYGVIIDMPVYLKVILRFSRSLVLLWSTVPLIVFFVTLVTWAVLSDHLLKEGLLDLSELRMCNTAIGTIGPGILIIFCSYSSCYYQLTVFLYIICLGMTAIFHSGAGLNAIDLSPNYAGTLMGIAHTISSLTIFAPYFLEKIVPRVTLLDWRYGFWVDWAVITVGFFFYCLFGSSKLQEWNEPNSRKSTELESQAESD